jgi:hypothetical protein
MIVKAEGIGKVLLLMNQEILIHSPEARGIKNGGVFRVLRDFDKGF